MHDGPVCYYLYRPMGENRPAYTGSCRSGDRYYLSYYIWGFQFYASCTIVNIRTAGAAFELHPAAKMDARVIGSKPFSNVFFMCFYSFQMGGTVVYGCSIYKKEQQNALGRSDLRISLLNCGLF